MNWWQRFKIKWAKKILNKHAPKGEFIAYINKLEEKKLKKWGGSGHRTHKTGIKSFLLGGVGDFFSGAVDFVTGNVRALSKISDFWGKYQGWFTAISIGIQIISWLNKPKMPDTPTMDNASEQNAKGVLLNKQSANGPIPVIYGKRKVGGTLAFLETSGTDNEFLYMVIALCEGQVESCEKIYIDDKQVTWSGTLTHGTERTVGSGDSNFYKDTDSKITVTWYDGRDDQTYNSTVGALSSWTSNHRLRGVSYLALKFKWSEDCFMGIPAVHAEIKGRKVYNANLDGTKTGGSGSHREDTASTWAWSDNPVWCTLDYMRNSRFGLGIANSYFDGDYADWQTASDVCDADVTAYGSTTIDLLDMNYVVDTKKRCLDNLKEMVSGFRGYLNYANGEYKVISESTGSASISLTEDNIIGGIKVASLNKNSRYNRVIVTFVNPDKNYQTDEAQWPPIDDSGLTSADQHSTMKTADGGFLLEGRFDYPSITSPYQAQEIAEIICRRSRNNLNVSLRCDATGIDLMVGELVNVTHATPAFSAKTFRVQGMQINEDLTVEIQLAEYQASYYTWTTQAQAATIPDTALPNPFSVSVPASVTLTDELIEYSDGVVLTRLNIVVGASTDKFVQYYQVETKKTSESDYKIIAKGTVLNYHQLNVVDGIEYSVRVKAINTMGVSSGYTSGTRTIVGATETPADVDELSVSMVGSNQMQLSWEPVADLDVSYYAIRYQDVTSNASWASSTNLTQVVRRKSNNVTINARTGAFLIKAVDKLGNESDNEKIIYSNISGLEHFSTPISTLNEESASAVTAQTWNGTFDGDCVKGMDSNNDDVATLDTITLFDSTVGNFDSPSGDFDLGGTDQTSNPTYYNKNIESSGLYIGSNTISLDAVYDATFQSTINMIANDLYDLFDSGRGASLFDDAQGPFDGSSGTNCDAYLQVGSSESSLGAITAYQDISQQSTLKGRYFKFRLKLTSGNNKARPEVSKMQIKLVLEKRLESGEDIASLAGAKAITYTNAFYASPAVGIAAQNMATGDYYAITSKTKTGFTITFYNSSAAAQNRTFDYVAKGYGLKS